MLIFGITITGWVLAVVGTFSAYVLAVGLADERQRSARLVRAAKSRCSRPAYYSGDEVHMEDVARFVKDWKALNNVDLRKCEVYEDGRAITIPDEAIEEFEETGLAVRDFFIYRMWDGASLQYRLTD